MDNFFRDEHFPALNADFFRDSAVNLAPRLLGKLLIRRYQDQILGGIITETEAYLGEEDQGCHARAGKTERTSIMYGPPGRAYIYFTYGMHWMLNVVTGEEGFPAAVLIRAFYPLFGLMPMATLRPTGYIPGASNLQKGWTDGPAKLCQALGLNGQWNNTSLTNSSGDCWLAESRIIPTPEQIGNSSRIGLFTVPEPWKSIPWRWYIRNDSILPLLTQYV